MKKSEQNEYLKKVSNWGEIYRYINIYKFNKRCEEYKFETK